MSYRDEEVLADLHSQHLSVPTPRYVRTCDAPKCHDPINAGDAIVTTNDGDMMHEDCWEAFAKDALGYEEGIAE